MTTPHHDRAATVAAARPAPAARLVDGDEAARYLGCGSKQTFLTEVACGIWPPPLPLARLSGRRKRQVWDIRALDARIDELTGAAAADDPFDLDKEMGLDDA